ncbi:uncharacterized protein NFIA_005200 [Aspergillus fischeri NRRL 181]|uniref:BZIP domain-containing protein n=1 Tax=Neosartorya fischeri (strain ATCC 1020 / DSM 3700 / CBS 544.65 / FGSC A1164 / JCM 1740 / NRRL 181 / WB 181) TaxID=331117 RepID=A1DKB9_NEOFI|nr:conserved hypothetical protein [Aspergillus fischeri NRRL 181]EAW17158.1 conserved hypothetical protein [Aspergillus fischeri NRRL 181]KAG2003997.1 hypothetical protein GB937_009234 [Aspergillus fischeri]
MDDPKERRKIQNRLNQRASRRRKALLSSNVPESSTRKWTVYVAPSQETATSRRQNHNPPQGENDEATVHFCYVSLETRRIILNLLHDRVNRGILTHALSSELLLPVTQWNIICAMYTNATTIGLTMALLAEDIISPFNICGPVTANLPPSLQPTCLQRSIVHHPWIDLCAVSSVRDAVLRNLHLYSEDELCHDLFGGSSDCTQPTGLLIWGEAWDPSAYEISEKMFRKWEWLWRECPEVIRSTNYWRLQREEEILVISD